MTTEGASDLGLFPKPGQGGMEPPPGVAAVPPSGPARPGLGQALRSNVALDDVLGAIPGARNAQAGVRVARGIGRAVQQMRGAGEAPTAPVEAAPGAPPSTPAAAPAPTPDAPAPSISPAAAPPSAAQAAYQAAQAQQAASAPPVERLTPEQLHAARVARKQADVEMLRRWQADAQARAAARAASPAAPPAETARTTAPAVPAPARPAATRPAASAAASPVGPELTPTEIRLATQWSAAGMKPEAILQKILDGRAQAQQLAARLGTPSSEKVAADIKARNETGRWADEPAPKQ
jgi:hypothetical protein